MHIQTSQASGGLLTALPPPAAGKKKVVQFIAPIKPLADDDDVRTTCLLAYRTQCRSGACLSGILCPVQDDDVRPKKIAKTEPAKKGGAAALVASLPKPKNEELGGGAVLGSGGAKVLLSLLCFRPSELSSVSYSARSNGAIRNFCDTARHGLFMRLSPAI